MDHQSNANFLGPPFSIVPDMMEQSHHHEMFYPSADQGFIQGSSAPPPPMDFSSFEPDPDVQMVFQGQEQRYPPLQLNTLVPNPLPLLPTEPLPLLSPCEKKKTPSKQKRKSDPPNSSQVPFKRIPEYVHKILEKRKAEFADREFAERALSNLARKIASQASVMDEWVRAITEEDSNSFCVCVPRPKDGRMTITKATGNAGCKKVFPQIFICQVFRWPNIVFHHDIKSSSHCLHPGAIKPTTGNIKDDTSNEDMKDVICVNPYHYDLAPEAHSRFKKPPKPAKTVPYPQSDSTYVNTSEDDDEESDDEILPYDDDGVDYIKLWDQRERPQSIERQEITLERLLNELKVFTINREEKKFTKADLELLERMGVIDELKSVILSGEYLKHINKSVSPQKSSTDTSKNDIALMPPPRSNEHIVEQPIEPQSQEDEEDNAIQNLLDDIRGSFERQFDDEFEDLTDGGGGESRGDSRASSPFGNINIGAAFSMSDGQHLEDLAATAEDLLASSPDEMPLEGWSMPQEVFDNFLEAAASSTPQEDSDQFHFQNHDQF